MSKGEQNGSVAMHAVESSHIKAVGHDGQGGMIVEYKTGRRFTFNGVSETQFNDVLTAESVGKAVNALKVKGVLHQEPKAATEGARE